MSSGSWQAWFSAGGGCKGRHFVCFAENFGNLLTAAGFALVRDDAGAGWLAGRALPEDLLAVLELAG
jgi:hypothetical protein